MFRAGELGWLPCVVRQRREAWAGQREVWAEATGAGYWAAASDGAGLLIVGTLLAAVIGFFGEFLARLFAAFRAEARFRLDQSWLNSSMVSRPCAGLLRIWLARASSNR